MAIDTGSITISTSTPTVISGSIGAATRDELHITNLGPGSIFVGTSGVTTAVGYPVSEGQLWIGDNPNVVGSDVYAISDNSAVVRFIEFG